MRVSGNSMINAGIHANDLLIINRAIEVTHNKIVIAVIDGEFTVKRVKKIGAQLFLAPENNDYKSVPITSEMDVSIWGVVTYVIHQLS